MFKSIQPNLLSFDIEWVPDPLAGEILHNIKHNPPQSYLDSFQALWKDAGADSETPQPYIKTALCQIVSIAGIFREGLGNNVNLKLISLPADPEDKDKWTEKHIISTFLKAVGTRKPQLVGYNSLNADVPIIVERSIIHGLHGFGFAQRPEKPWEGVDYFSAHNDYNIDLAPILGKWANTPKLTEIASLSGIPGKIDVSGESVAKLWLDGKLKEIVNYNEFDAFTTHLLWARMAHFADLLSDAQYEKEQMLVRNLLESEINEGREHLKRFVNEWDRLSEIIKQRN
jgi:predicted PolB exonuclease-like 3'-5' exonuclease